MTSETRHTRALLAAAAVVLSGTLACTSGSPSAPSSNGGGGSNVSDTATITITGNGASPQNVAILQGGRVTFVNNDSRAHDMSSDPHPSHENCPPLDQVGFLSPGQARTSGNFTIVGSCGFHDHNLPSNASLQGRITIVAAQ